MERKREVDRRGSPWRVALALALVGVFNGVALGVDCTWDCTQLTICSGATQSCPNCDAGIWDQCDYWQQVRFPNTVIGRVAGGNRAADSQGQVVCMETTTCGDGSYSWFFVCGFGSCQLTPAVVQYCQTCSANGSVVNSKATHYVCTSAGCGG